MITSINHSHGHTDLLFATDTHGHTQTNWGTKNVDIEQLTYQIRGAIFEVNRILGPGFLEKVYERALLLELRERGLKVESQVSINVKYKGQNVGEYFADIVVEDLVILELKCLDFLQKIHEAQILNYLKQRALRLVYWSILHIRRLKSKDSFFSDGPTQTPKDGNEQEYSPEMVYCKIEESIGFE